MPVAATADRCLHECSCLVSLAKTQQTIHLNGNVARIVVGSRKATSIERELIECLFKFAAGVVPTGKVPGDFMRKVNSVSSLHHF